MSIRTPTRCIGVAVLIMSMYNLNETQAASTSSATVRLPFSVSINCSANYISRTRENLASGRSTSFLDVSCNSGRGYDVIAIGLDERAVVTIDGRRFTGPYQRQQVIFSSDRAENRLVPISATGQTGPVWFQVAPR